MVVMKKTAPTFVLQLTSHLTVTVSVNVALVLSVFVQNSTTNVTQVAVSLYQKYVTVTMTALMGQMKWSTCVLYYCAIQ